MSDKYLNKILIIISIATLFSMSVSGCSFMGDVMHAEGDYAHKIGDAFKRQGVRREAATTHTVKKKAENVY